MESFLFAVEDARRLAALRIGLFGLLAARLATHDYTAVAGQPKAFFDPVSLLELLPRMPSVPVATVLQIVAVALALLSAAGVAPRVTLPGAFACALVLNLMLNATGKIVHNDVVLMLCLLPLVASPRAASRAWALGRRGGRGPSSALRGAAYGWPIRAAMIVIGLAYLFAGLQKLRYSGLEWVTSDNLRYVLYASSDLQGQPNAAALYVAERPWLAHAAAAGALLTEIGFVACLPWARLRWIFVPAAVGLHLGILVTMGLDYSAQALAVLIVFVDWPRVGRAFRRARRRRTTGAMPRARPPAAARARQRPPRVRSRAGSARRSPRGSPR